MVVRKGQPETFALHSSIRCTTYHDFPSISLGEVLEVYYNVKLIAIYQHRLRIEFGLWLLLMSVAPSCSKEHFAPIYFVKGQHMAIYAHICTTYHFVGHTLYSRIKMSYTQCICKRSVRRLHQAIISFSGISVNDRLTKIWLRKADGRSTFTVR